MRSFLMRVRAFLLAPVAWEVAALRAEVAALRTEVARRDELAPVLAQMESALLTIALVEGRK